MIHRNQRISTCESSIYIKSKQEHAVNKKAGGSQAKQDNNVKAVNNITTSEFI